MEHIKMKKSVKGSPTKGKYLNENQVIKSLSQKRDLRIQRYEIQILVNNSPKKSFDLGNKSWGKINFLVDYCGYRIANVSKFTGHTFN